MVAFHRLSGNRSNRARRREELPTVSSSRKPIAVRVDATFDEIQRTFIDAVARTTGVAVTFSASEPVATIPEAVIESIPSLVARCEGIDRCDGCRMKLHRPWSCCSAE